MTDQPTNEQLTELLVRNAAIAAEGSFSDRNPLLGKMKKCPYCGQRRRLFGEKCCNPEYLVTCLAEIPRSAVAKKRKIPRLSRNRPPMLEIHEKLLELERTPGYKEYEGISQVVEAQIMNRRRARKKIRRQQQNLSRKINRRAR